MKPSRTSRTSSRSFKVSEDMRICMSLLTSYACDYVFTDLIYMRICLSSPHMHVHGVTACKHLIFCLPLPTNHLLNCWRLLISNAFVGQRGEYAKKVDLYEQKQKQVCLFLCGFFFCCLCLCVQYLFALICSAITSFFLSNGAVKHVATCISSATWISSVLWFAIRWP